MHPEPQHIPSVIQSLAPIITQYGYLAVGGLLFLEDFGVLVPGETVLIAASFYAGLDHQLHIVIIFIVGFVAAVMGDNVGFAIGEYGGHPLAEKYGRYIFLTPARIAKAEAFFNKYGGRVVAIARFVDGLRQINGIVAGLSEMRWARFLIYNALGAAIWVGLWSMVGYYGGNHISAFLRYQLYASILTMVGLVVFVAIRVAKKKRHKAEA